MPPDSCSIPHELHHAPLEGSRWPVVQDSRESDSRFLLEQPLSQRIDEADPHPTRCVPALKSAPFTFDGSPSRFHDLPTLESNFALTLGPSLSASSRQSLSRHLKGPDRKKVMEKPSISCRELRSLAPSLVPYCFPQKPHHDSTLPRIHAQNLSDGMEIGRTYPLAPVVPKVESPSDLKAREDRAHCTLTSTSADGTVSERESICPSLESPGIEVCQAQEWLPTVNETAKHRITASFPVAPSSWTVFPVSPSHNGASNLRPYVVCSMDSSMDRAYGNFGETERGGQTEDTYMQPLRSQLSLALPCYANEDGTHIPNRPRRIITRSIGRPASSTSLAPVSSLNVTGNDSHAPTSVYKIITLSDQPPPDSEYSVKVEYTGSSERGGGGNGDNWRRESGHGRQGGGSGGDEKGHGGGAEDDDDDDDDSEPPRKRVPKKTSVACHFCRYRKLKCDGGRPTCYNCARRSLACAYDEQPRRRGPGRKKKDMSIQLQEENEPEQPRASTSETLLPRSSSFVYGLRGGIPPPLPQLPPPPPPAYNYRVGQIPRTSVGLGTPPRASGSGTSGTYTQQAHQGRYDQYGQHSQQAQHAPHPERDRDERPHQHVPHSERDRGERSYQHAPHSQSRRNRDEQPYQLSPPAQISRELQPYQHTQQSHHSPRERFYQQQPLAPQQSPQARHDHRYRIENSQARGPGYPSQADAFACGSGPSNEADDLDYPSEGDDEGTSGSRSKRQASSPPDDLDQTIRQRRRYDYDRGGM